MASFVYWPLAHTGVKLISSWLPPRARTIVTTGTEGVNAADDGTVEAAAASMRDFLPDPLQVNENFSSEHQQACALRTHGREVGEAADEVDVRRDVGRDGVLLGRAQELAVAWINR